MKLSFFGFDILWGMDWFSEHWAMVDCELKSVTLRLLENFDVVVVGENGACLSSMVSALEAHRLLSDGGEAYLAYVMNPGVKGV